MMRRAIFALAAAAVMAAAPLRAEPSPAAGVSLERYLPPPPAPGSDRARAEMEELRQVIAHASPDALAAAAYDDRHEDATVFVSAIGPDFDMARLPATAAMIEAVRDTEEKASNIAKKAFHRDRPWIVDPSIATCTPHKPGPAANAYPSGHATAGFAMAVILTSLMPSKAGAIMARAAGFAENRLVCGYHVRSDIVAGQQFGTILALQLMQNPAFRKSLEASRAELEAAHLAP